MNLGLYSSSQIAVELSSRLRKHRIAQKFTQAELASRVGVTWFRRLMSTTKAGAKNSIGPPLVQPTPEAALFLNIPTRLFPKAWNYRPTFSRL
jgi:transcriptional regulator with XRE-family HTH domain